METNNNKKSTTAMRLKEAMDLRNMNGVELSEKSGINRPSISCYLSGKYEPKQAALYRMGRALDVSEMWLAGYDVPMERLPEQKETDALVDFSARMKKEKGFKELILKISSLNPKQLDTIRSMVDSWQDPEDPDAL